MSELLPVAFAALAVLLAQAPLSWAAAPLSIAISGNQFVNGSGQAIRLLGVNHPSFEYACVDGYGYNDGHMDAADATAVASWNANAVRVPLNEDCWLGINGQPNSSGGPSETLTQAGYQHAVEEYVAALNAHGLYAILDLHWSAPGTQVADGQQPMPDDHSAAFWTSVASAFKNNPAVVFDVFNEPFSPADPRSGEDPAHPVSWACWDQGGCVVDAYANTSEETAHAYTAVGMQTLVSAIRNTGARQPVMVGGLDYANDLTGWAQNAPDDPLNQEAASFHNYMGKTCDNVACWNSQVASVAANVPVVTGEFAEDDFAEAHCEDKTPSTFDQDYMGWADEHGVGYLAWGWIVLSQQEMDAAGCSAYYLLEGYDGTPAAPNGTALHDHLLTLPPGGVISTGANPVPTGGNTSSTGATSTTTTGNANVPTPVIAPPLTLALLSNRVRLGGRRVSFTLRSGQNCAATLTGHTASSYALGKGKRKRVSLGTIHFTLKAGKATTVVLTLSSVLRKLLAASHTLKLKIMVTLVSTGRPLTVTNRTVTLRMPARH